MTKKAAPKAPTKNTDDLLKAVFTVCLLDKQLSKDALDHAVHTARARANRVVENMGSLNNATLDYDVLGLVIYRWQRIPKYLDEDGNPLPLPARGRGKSIQMLFSEIHRAGYFVDGMKHMLQTRRISKINGNRYLPNEGMTLSRTLTPEVVVYLTDTINRLVATVLYNTSLTSLRTTRLIERTASVTDLPKKQVPAFKKFALEQGAAFIHTLNDWLESRRDVSDARIENSTHHQLAGIHLFGFIEK